MSKKEKRSELQSVRRQRKMIASPSAIDATPVVKTHYGTLSIEDIARATSTLPLKPPGK